MIECGGRALDPVESRSLGIYDKELLELSTALVEFEKFISCAKTCIVYIDNLPLVQALKSKIPFTKRLCKFQIIMSQFPGLMIKHIAGNKNTLADDISRMSSFYLNEINENSGVSMDMQEMIDLLKLKDAESDSHLKKLVQEKLIKILPPRKKLQKKLNNLTNHDINSPFRKKGGMNYGSTKLSQKKILYD